MLTRMALLKYWAAAVKRTNDDLHQAEARIAANEIAKAMATAKMERIRREIIKHLGPEDAAIFFEMLHNQTVSFEETYGGANYRHPEEVF